MSLEHNEQEEGPGAFLSLSGGQGSASPFRGPPAADTSPRVTVKQEQGTLEPYLSLQQPSQESPAQLVHAQELPCLDQAEGSNVEELSYEQNTAVSPAETRLEQLSNDRKESGASELDKSSIPQSEEPSSLVVPSEHPFTGHESHVSTKPLPEQQRHATTWLNFVEQQKPPSSSGISQQQNINEAHSFGCSNPSSLHGISDQKQSTSPLSLQVSPKQEKPGGDPEDEKLTVPTEDEKVPSLQPSIEHHALFLHRTGVLSPQSDQARDVPLRMQEQKVMKGLTEPVNLTSLQASSDQQRHSLKQWHKSAFIQAHMPSGPTDGSPQGPLAEKNLECLQESSAQQTSLGSERVPRFQAVSHCDSVRTQQEGFVPPSASPLIHDRTGVFCTKPSLSSNHVDQCRFSRDKELKLSVESPFAQLAASQGAERKYPSPMATHEAVLADKRLFMETLQSLHAALNLHLSLPKVEGNDLDLHKLYKEVTCRGGLELVTNGRKWHDIARAFGFLLNAMNATSILERTYISTLHHYEQVYFMGAGGRIVPVPAALSSPSSALSDQKDGGGSYDMESRPAITGSTQESAQAFNVDPTSSVGSIVSGAIDGKFEDGYLVTVMVGARKLRGVLYHAASTDIPFQNAQMPSMMQSVDSEIIQYTDVAPPKVGRKRKKREVFRKDPNAPRQNRTGYNFFFAEQRAKLKTMQPDKDRAISKMIGELWSKLSEDEKTPYQVKGVLDKERYVKEMKEYKEKIKLPVIGLNESQSINAPLHSQLPCTQLSQTRPDHDLKARASMLAFSHNAPEGVSSFVPPQMPVAAISSRSVQTQLPLTTKSESSKAQEAASLHLGRATIRSGGEHESITTDSLNCLPSIAVSQPLMQGNTPNASAISFSVSDPSVTSAAVDMSKFLIEETSPKSLSQSERQSQGSGPNLSKTEEHVSAMEL